MTSRRFVAAIVWCGLLVAAGCRTATVHNVQRAALGAPATATPAELSEAIWAAGRREGWRVREVEPGKLRAEKTVRTHRALVDIDYDATAFSITLVEANDLLYDGTSIHKTYNVWVAQLEKSIQDEIRFRYR